MIQKIKLKSITFFGLLILCGGLAQADEKDRTAEYLHNAGIAYCLSKSKNYEYEANIAQGGYFQIGNHSIEAAKLLERYVDQQLGNELNGYKGATISAYLMRCLEISYSAEYQDQVKQALEFDLRNEF